MGINTLYPHQISALEKLRPGAILVGGVGSGKTLTAIGFIFRKFGGKSPIIGDTDYSLMDENKQIYVITTARKRESMDWTKEASYFGIIPKVDSWNNIKKYVGVKNAFFIFDEQRLVGSGEWVKSFLRISKDNEWILLSATPGDTWLDYIPVMVANGYYKNRTEFIRRHVVFSNFSKFPKVERYIEVQRLIRIRDSLLVNMYFTRKTKRHNIFVIVEHDKDKTTQVYHHRWNIFDNVPIVNKPEVAFLMRKVANSDPSRLIKLKEIFERHQKLIVFYNFDFELEILRRFAEENEIPYSEWNGHKHESILSGFPSWLYLCQYISASEAWNAIETNAVVFYSQNYSYKILEQSSGRIDRLNTTYIDLWYYHFVSKSPIDLAIRDALSRKKKFNESAFLGSREKHML